MKKDERTYMTRTFTVEVQVRDNIKPRVLESLRAALEACAKGMFFVTKAKARLGNRPAAEYDNEGES